jgi:hypothetical protein
LIGFISLIIGTIIICILLNLLRPSDDRLNWFAIITSTIVVPILWHIIGYFIDGPEVLMWLKISLPVSIVFSFFAAMISNFVFYFVRNEIKKR